MAGPIDEYGQRYIDSRKDTDPREGILHKAENRIKNAKLWLILVGCFTILLSVIYYFTVQNQTNLLASVIDASIGFIFIGLALWVDKKPRVATLCGLIFYIVTIIIGALANPAAITAGLLIKIIVIAALANGYKAARQAEELREELNIIDLNKSGDLPIDQL